MKLFSDRRGSIRAVGVSGKAKAPAASRGLLSNLIVDRCSRSGSGLGAGASAWGPFRSASSGPPFGGPDLANQNNH
jgi:hypothetical protein